MASIRTITTDRLTLIQADDSDFTATAFHTVWSDEVAAQSSIRGPTKNLSESRTRLQSILSKPGALPARIWAIFENTTSTKPPNPADPTTLPVPETCAGMLLLTPAARVGGARGGVWEIGYGFAPRFWGRGYATEAGRAAISDLSSEIDSGAVSIVRAPPGEKLGGAGEGPPTGVPRRPRAEDSLRGLTVREGLGKGDEGSTILDVKGKGRVGDQWVEGMWVVRAWVGPAHKASLRVLEKLGLRDGVLKDFGGDDWWLMGGWEPDAVWELDAVFSKGREIVWSD